MGAGIRDPAGRVLLVKPTYAPGWELPGGSTEADESPRESCRRELAEELGLDLQPGRLLVLEWRGPELDRTESLMLLYDGGVTGQLAFTLPQQELEACVFVAPRLRAALVGLAGGRLVEMEDGRVLPWA